MEPRRLAAVLVVLLVCLLACALAAGGAAPLLYAGGAAAAARRGEAARQKARASENLVVDTLNLAHWLRRGAPSGGVGLPDILAAIDATAPALRRRHPGRVVYVTKGRESAEAPSPRAHAQYRAAAHRNGVYVAVVERAPGARKAKGHAALGRDDFYMMFLAGRMGCAVLTRDRFRDLPEMKAGGLGRFNVRVYAPGGDQVDYVNPAAPEFRRLRRPAAVDYLEALPGL